MVCTKAQGNKTAQYGQETVTNLVWPEFTAKSTWSHLF